MIWGQQTASRKGAGLWPRGRPSLRELDLSHTSPDPHPSLVPICPSILPSSPWAHLYFDPFIQQCPAPPYSLNASSSHSPQGLCTCSSCPQNALAPDIAVYLPHHIQSVSCHILRENQNKCSLLHPSLPPLLYFAPWFLSLKIFHINFLIKLLSVSLSSRKAEVFWLCWVFVAARGYSLVAVSRGFLSSCSEWASHCSGFSCGVQVLGQRLQ